MQQSTCRGCQRSLDDNSGKNIFDNEIQVLSTKESGSCDKNRNMKLSTGIELITGQVVLREEKLPQYLCEACHRNVEAFVNFRFQLLKCRDNFHNGLKVSEISFNAENSDGQSKRKSENSYKSKNSHSKFKFIGPDNLFSKSTSEDVVSVDDNTNPSFVSTCRLQNDQESSSFAENFDDRQEEFEIRLSDHDIESEIDVCSGEDDEVLELDVQKIKNETVEINSSSESDIEVCDYEPSSKKRNYNTLSPIMKF